jgi:hypothetical protein
MVTMHLSCVLVALQELEGAHMAAAEELEALFEKRMEVSLGRGTH